MGIVCLPWVSGHSGESQGNKQLGESAQQGRPSPSAQKNNTKTQEKDALLPRHHGYDNTTCCEIAVLAWHEVYDEHTLFPGIHVSHDRVSRQSQVAQGRKGGKSPHFQLFFDAVAADV